MIDSEELVFKVDDLRYHALAWGPVDAPVVLGCHGWLDNALSFARLGPALRSFRFVSVDMSGHGLSDHRSADATYNIWDDLPQLQQIVDRLSISQVTTSTRAVTGLATNGLRLVRSSAHSKVSLKQMQTMHFYAQSPMASSQQWGI